MASAAMRAESCPVTQRRSDARQTCLRYETFNQNMSEMKCKV